MTDPRAALTALITEHSALTGARADRLARRIVEEWLPVVRAEVRAEIAQRLGEDAFRIGKFAEDGPSAVQTAAFMLDPDGEAEHD